MNGVEHLHIENGEKKKRIFELGIYLALSEKVSEN